MSFKKEFADSGRVTRNTQNAEQPGHDEDEKQGK